MTTDKTIEDEIKDIIAREFNPTHYEVVNESYKHVGHAGDDGSGQTHFKLIVVSSVFEGKSRVAQQKLVNAAINNLFSKGLHAVSMALSVP